MAEQKTDAIIALKSEVTQLQAIIGLFNKDEVAVKAMQEIAYLEAHAIRMPAIRECEPISVLLAVKSVLKQNLTLDPHANLVYIKTRNINTGTQAQPVWKKALEIEPTVNGRISFTRMCGRILDIKRPEVEFDSQTGQVKAVSVELLVPSIPQPRWERYDFNDGDIYRWRRASHVENRRSYDNANEQKRAGKPVPDDEVHNYANPNYSNFKGGIDPEFARAKAAKHALKKLGTNQNELKPGQLVIHASKIIDVNADRNATADEVKFTPHEDVTNNNNDLPL